MNTHLCFTPMYVHSIDQILSPLNMWLLQWALDISYWCYLVCTEFTVMSFTCEDFFRLHWPSHTMRFVFWIMQKLRRKSGNLSPGSTPSLLQLASSGRCVMSFGTQLLTMVVRKVFLTLLLLSCFCNIFLRHIKLWVDLSFLFLLGCIVLLAAHAYAILALTI